MRESIAAHWRRIPARYRLEGTVCRTCNTYYFPPRAVCPKCRSKGKIEPYTFKGTGKVVTYTRVYVPPKGFEHQVPYFLAIVELDEGTRVLGQVVDTSRVEIGMRVKAVFRKIQQNDPEGLKHYGYKFVPLREGG